MKLDLTSHVFLISLLVCFKVYVDRMVVLVALGLVICIQGTFGNVKTPNLTQECVAAVKELRNENQDLKSRLKRLEEMVLSQKTDKENPREKRLLGKEQFDFKV